MSSKNIVTVKDDKGVEIRKIYVRTPNKEAVTQADMYRAKKWQECLMGDVLTKRELGVILEKRGIWTAAEDTKQAEIIKEISDLEKDLYLNKSTRSVEFGKNLAIDIRRKRIELRDLLANKIAFEENTAEAIADNARFDYLVSQCIYDESNSEKVYNTLEDYNAEEDDTVPNHGAAKLAEMMYGLDENFEKSLPENKWLQTYHLVDEDLNMVNADGHLVDTENRKINDKGQYVDDNGKVIDKDGNPINDDGNYEILGTYEVDAPKRKSRTKKTA